MKHPEYQLQKQVCKYLELQYKDVLFLSDTVASLKLTMGQAVRNKAIQKGGFKTPDLLILEPRGIWHGLFIELKASQDDLFKKRDKALKTEHVEGQWRSIQDLRRKGYFACFSCGFFETKQIIDTYMNL